MTANWPEGPVCGRCYTNALRRRGQCSSCGQERRLVDPPGPGSNRCASCAGVAVVHVCGRCGIEDKLYKPGLCPRCVLADRATDLLADDDGVVPAAMAPIYVAIVGSPSALHALGWLLRGKSAALLTELVRTGVPPTHKMLDALPPTRAVSTSGSCWWPAAPSRLIRAGLARLSAGWKPRRRQPRVRPTGSCSGPTPPGPCWPGFGVAVAARTSQLGRPAMPGSGSGPHTDSFSGYRKRAPPPANARRVKSIPGCPAALAPDTRSESSSSGR